MLPYIRMLCFLVMVLLTLVTTLILVTEQLFMRQNWGGVTIGKNSLIAAQSYIIDTDHGIHAGELIRNQQNTVAPVSIGEDVWIAAGCKILKGSQIHDGAIIGAASLVKGEIPANAIAVGIPAKVKKIRE